MQIRRATSADAEAIERIRVRGWQAGYRHVFPPADLDAMEVDWSRWAAALDDPANPQTCVVAEIDGRIAGWATYGAAGIPEDCGEIRGLYVDPDRWKEGIGRALVEHAEHALAKEWDAAVLYTLADNPRTRRFYEAAGWAVDGTTGSFDSFGVSAPVVRYAKRLTSSTSRS